MAITTYAALQTAIASTLNRSDMTADIQTFIALAEGDLNSELRHWQMEKRSDATLSTRYLDFPADLIEVLRFTVGGRQMDMISQAKMSRDRGEIEDTAGHPRFYCLSAGQIEVIPSPNDEYTASLIYLSMIDPLTDAAPSNWLLRTAPTVYYYGALIHAAPFLVEDERLPVWTGLYQKAVDQLNASGERGRYSGAGLTMR